MKRNHRQMWRTVVALALTFTLVFGTASTAFATQNVGNVFDGNNANIVKDINGDDKVTYVSLGESMTNGYGTEGYYTNPFEHDPNEIITAGYLAEWGRTQYDNTDTPWTIDPKESNMFGYMQSDVETYASMFAEYLEAQGNEVEWLPMAISGQRPEDFYWFMQDAWTATDDAASDYQAGLFNEDGTYNGDLYTTEIWKNGNCNQGKSSRYLNAGYGKQYTYQEWNSLCKQTRPGGEKGEGVYALYWDTVDCKTIMVHRENLTSNAKGVPQTTYTDDNGRELTLVGNGYWMDETEATQQKALADFREEYRANIASADVITVNLGTHSFSSVVSARMMSILSGGAEFYNDGRASMDAILEQYPEYCDLYDEVIVLVEKEVTKMLPNMDASKLERIIDVYCYATFSFLINYDKSLEVIREINPDAQVIIVGMSNFLDGIKFEMKDGSVLDLGGIFGLLVDFTNIYRAGWVEDSKECIFVPAVDDMHLLVDELADRTKGKTEVDRVFMAKLVDSLIDSSQIEIYRNDLIKHHAVSQDCGDNCTMNSGNKDYSGDGVDCAHMAQGLWDQISYFEEFLIEYIPMSQTGRAEMLEDASWEGESLTWGNNTVTTSKANPYSAGDNYADKKESSYRRGWKDSFMMDRFAGTEVQGVKFEEITWKDSIRAVGGIYDDLCEIAATEVYDSEGFMNLMSLDLDFKAAKAKLVREGIESLNGAEKAVIYLWMRCFMAEGIGCHPSVEGHTQVYNNLIEAYENNYTGKDYVVDGSIDMVVGIVTEYYDEAYELAYDYAEDEGYIDATIDGIKDVEKALKVALDEANKTGMSDELKAELEAAYEGALETTAQLEKLILEADKLDDATYAETMALLVTLEGNLNDFCSVMEQVGVDAVDQLWTAYETLKPIVIEQLKIAVEKGTAWLMEKVQEVYDELVEWLINEALPGADKAMYDWLYENPETVIGFFIEYADEIEFIVDQYGEDAVAVLTYVLYTYGPDAVEYAIENPEEAIAKWVEWYNKHGHKVWPMIDKYLETLDEMGAFDGLKAAAAELEAYVIEYAEKVVEQLEAKIDELNDAAQAALEELKAAIEAVDVDAILAALEELYDAGVAIYEGATSGYYAATDESYYVALGDTDVEYAEIVAAELDLEKDQFVNAGIDGMRAEDLRMILDADYEGDAYGKANFGDVADLRAELVAEIEKADLITLGFSNNTITEFAAAQIADKAEMNWAAYLGEDGAATMETAIAEIKAALVAEGVDAEAIDLVVTAVESYAYACTGFACNYPEAINAIKAINPDAQVVVVGMYNTFEGAVLEVEENTIPVGEFVGALVDLANVHYTSYAILTGNAVYVHAPAVETKATFDEAMGIEGFATVLTDLDSLEPTAAGHEYIAQQIIDAMNVVSKSVYDAQKLIDEIAAFGEITRDNLADAKALAEAARAAYDALTDEEKELIGLDNYKVLVDFELAVAKVELGVAEDIASAEKALAEAEAKAAEIERALKITESTVTNLKAKVVNKSQIKVTWTADETTPDQYRVTLMRDGKKVGTYWVAGDKETVTIKNVLRGTNFTVRVTPVAKVDGQKYFSIYKTSNKVKTQLQKANLTVKKSGKAKVIKSADQNSTGFQIYISKDKKFKKDVKKINVYTGKKGLNVKVKAKNFKKGTNYVKVRAYTKVNGKTTYGAWSGTVKVTK